MSRWAESRYLHLVEAWRGSRLRGGCSWTAGRSAAPLSSGLRLCRRRRRGCAAWTRGGSRLRSGWTRTGGWRRSGFGGRCCRRPVRSPRAQCAVGISSARFPQAHAPPIGIPAPSRRAPHRINSPSTPPASDTRALGAAARDCKTLSSARPRPSMPICTPAERSRVVKASLVNCAP